MRNIKGRSSASSSRTSKIDCGAKTLRFKINTSRSERKLNQLSPSLSRRRSKMSSLKISLSVLATNSKWT
jgi:hypothetical protein